MRLNKDVRLQITRGAMKKLDEEVAALAKEESLLCQRCYDTAVPKAVRDALGGVANLDDTWVNKTYEFQFNVAGQYVRLKCSTPLMAPYRYTPYGCTFGKPVTMESHEKLVERVRKWQGDSLDLKRRCTQTKQTLETLLKTVGSTDSLFKVWPEGKKFYSVPPLQQPPTIQLPAVQMEALNKALGLK